jgi:DNA-binding NarL/FixJ family response regulator
MSNVLLIYDEGGATLAIEQILSTLDIVPIRLALDKFHVDFLLSEMFDLIIFEIFGENSSCITILKQLEKLAITTGMSPTPVIVVTEQGADIIEQALRIAKVNFFFIRPVVVTELVAAIEQSLLQPKASCPPDRDAG